MLSTHTKYTYSLTHLEFLSHMVVGYLNSSVSFPFFWGGQFCDVVKVTIIHGKI